MSEPVEIHTTEINGASMRFFSGPSDGPDLPWNAMDDLRAICRSDDEGDLDAHLQSFRGLVNESLKTVETTSGAVTIVPVLGTIGFFVKAVGKGLDLVEVGEDFQNAASDAMDILLKQVPANDRFATFVVAARSAASPMEITS